MASSAFAQMRRVSVLLFVLNVPCQCDGDTLLRGGIHFDGGAWVVKDKARVTMNEVQTEIEGALGESYQRRVKEELGKAKESLRYVFAALPKNANGRVEADAVRYALHRYFMHRYAMSVKGLEPTLGQNYSDSSPLASLNGGLPQFLEDLFEARLHQQGFNLQDLAQLAVVLEHIVYQESVEMLKVAFKAQGLSMNATDGTPDQIENLMDTFLAVFYSHDVTGLPASPDEEMKVLDTVLAFRKRIPSTMPRWAATQAFLRKASDRVYEDIGEDNKLNALDTASRMVDTIMKTYGAFEDSTCHEIKSALVAMTEHNTGRVKLVDFYKAVLAGQWQFAENGDYLRSLGAVDDSVPGSPSVIIANYIGSESNCIGTSSMHTYCCLSDCDALQRVIERRIRAPTARPKDILAAVSDMPSATVEAPRNLSQSLEDRLNDVASANEGRVPLHSKLFNQWMHHAYPNECPYPMKQTEAPASTPKRATARDAEEFVANVEHEKEVKEERKQKAMKNGGGWSEDYFDGAVAELPWSNDEELFIEKPYQATGSERAWRALRGLVLIAALSYAVLVLRQTFDPDVTIFGSHKENRFTK